jgi:hypothetical protein
MQIEYSVVIHEGPSGMLEEILNEHGADGWDLVSLDRVPAIPNEAGKPLSTRLVFRRPKVS